MMSRRDIAKIRTLPEPSTVIGEAILCMAQVDEFSGTWRSMNDIARMMHASFDLPRTIQLTGWSINRALSNDVRTKHMIDSRDLNCTGVFRDSYTLGKSKQRFLYLCQPGTCPHKPGHGHKWSDFITEPLPKSWVPSRSNLYPDNYEGLKKRLKSHLQKKSGNDDGQKRKSKEQDSSSYKKHKGATKKSFI